MTNARGFDVSLNAQSGLIHKLTRKCFGRLIEAGVNDCEYEDIYQINCMTFVKASQMYDPNKGVTFSAYLGQAIYNEFNKFASKVITEKHELGLVAYDDFTGEESHTDLLDIFSSSLSDSAPDALSKIVDKDTARELISHLSATAKLVIRELISPSEAVKKTFDGLQAHSELAKQQGEKYIRVPKDIDIKTIKIHYGFRSRDINGLKKEFKKHLGVEID